MVTHQDDDEQPRRRPREDAPDNERRQSDRRAENVGQAIELASAIAKLGVPAAIALGLSYVLAVLVLTRIDAHAAESRRDNQLQLRVLQQICINVATTPEGRAGCERLTWALDQK